MATTNMNNLTTLVKRLEAATSRLEDMAGPAGGPQSDSNRLHSNAGSAAAADTSSQSSPPIARQAPAALPPAIEAFDSLINGYVKKFTNLSESIGGPVAEQAAAVLRTFAAEREFLIVTTKAKKPEKTSPVFMETLKDIQETMGQVQNVRESNAASPLAEHLGMVSESIAMVGWVTMESDPKEYTTECFNSAHFRGNRVMVAYKQKDPTQVEWVKSYFSIGKALIAYINEFYPNGLTWNNKDGIDPSEALHQVKNGSSAPTGGAPPPPPPPPPPPAAALPSSRKPAPDMGAVFSDLTKGEAVTAGLRKVDPSQQTHKNPALRSSGPTRSDSLNSASSSTTTGPGRGKSPVPGKKPDSMRTKKPPPPPRKELNGTQWVIENYDNAEGVIEIEAEHNHSVIISRCRNTVFQVHGKLNAISVDSSSRVSLIVDTLIASVDVIKVQKFQLEVRESLRTILLDQVDEAQIYLAPLSQGVETFTSKCTSINLYLLNRDKNVDPKEVPLPEQIVTTVMGGVPVSKVVEHAG